MDTVFSTLLSIDVIAMYINIYNIQEFLFDLNSNTEQKSEIEDNLKVLAYILLFLLFSQFYSLYCHCPIFQICWNLEPDKYLMNSGWQGHNF
jgi:hypothetical protein